MKFAAPEPLFGETADEKRQREGLGRLIDLDRSRNLQGAGGFELVRGANGHCVLAPIALPTYQPETEECDNAQPMSRIPAMFERDVPGRTRRLLAAIEDTTAGMTEHLMDVSHTGQVVPQILVTGHYAGFNATKPWQVGYIGNGKWRCNGGSFTWLSLDADGSGFEPVIVPVEGHDFVLNEGWIAIDITVQPRRKETGTMGAPGGGGYDVTDVALVATEALVLEIPRKSVETDGVVGLGTDSATNTWSAGRYMIPVARVARPSVSGGREFIQQRRSAHCALTSAEWGGSLPSVTG